MATSPAQKPSKEDNSHWDLTRQHGQDIGELKAGQGRLEVSVGHLTHSVDTGFVMMRETLNERTQPAPSTPWVQIAGLIITLMIVLGSFLSFGFNQITSSQQRETDMRFNAVKTEMNARAIVIDNYRERERNHAYETGVVIETLKSHTTDITHNHEHAQATSNTLTTLAERVSRLEATQQK